MIGIVLCGHGHLASSLLESAEMIMGPQSTVTSVALEPTDNLDALRERIGEAIAAGAFPDHRMGCR